MGNTWVTLWLTYFYHEYTKWEMSGWHYGHCSFIINALNGKNLDYIMVTVLLPWNAKWGNIKNSFKLTRYYSSSTIITEILGVLRDVYTTAESRWLERSRFELTGGLGYQDSTVQARITFNFQNKWHTVLANFN